MSTVSDDILARVTDDLRADVAAWLGDHPEYTRERYLVERNEALRLRQEAETKAADEKRANEIRNMRELFEKRAGDPAALASLYRQVIGKAPRTDVEHEYVQTWVGGMWPEVAAALESAPRKKVYKPELDKVVNYDGPKKDRSAEPYWDQVPAGVRKAVSEGRCQPIDESVAAVIWQHNRRVYRAVKDKTQRIKREEIAAQLRVTTKTVQRSISRMVAAGELEVVSAGKGNHNGAIYTFPARESEHAHRTPATVIGLPVRQSEHAHRTQSR